MWEILTLCENESPYIKDPAFVTFSEDYNNKGLNRQQLIIDYITEKNNIGRFKNANDFLTALLVSRPTYKNQETCSNPFWFDYMRHYFQKDAGLRPTFATIQKQYETEIVPNCSKYFKLPDLKSQTLLHQHSQARPSHLSSDRSDRSTTTTLVDFVDSQFFDPQADDRKNFENYQNIVNSNIRQHNQPTLNRDFSIDDVFTPLITPPNMPGVHQVGMDIVLLNFYLLKHTHFITYTRTFFR